MSAATEIRVTMSKLYRVVATRGPAWKWYYELPERTQVEDDGRVVRYRPHATTKAEIVATARRLHVERPLTLVFDDGTTKHVKS